MYTPVSLYSSWCFAEGMSFLGQKQWVSSRKRWEKQKLDYVNTVWKRCDRIPTWWNQTEIIVAGKTNAPSSERIGELHQGQTAPHSFEKRTPRNHARSSPCSAAETPECPFSSMSSDSVTIQSSATFLQVSWLAFRQLELRLFPPSILCDSRIICTHTCIIYILLVYLWF